MSRILKAASGIALATLVSRVLGLIRDVLMVHALGATWAMGAFVLAWTAPNLFRRLFGEGALSAALVPAYARTLEEKGPDSARRLLGGVTGMVLLILGSGAILVWLVALCVPGDWVGRPDLDAGISAEQHGNLVLHLLAVMFPYAVPICLVAVMAGALNSHGRFALPAMAPIVLNTFWIGALLLAPAFGMDETAERQVQWLAWALLAAGLAQLTLTTIPLRRLGQASLPRSPFAEPGSRAIFATMAPALIGLSLNQVNALLDHVLAAYLIEPGAPTYLYLANRLLLFPHALTGLALATAVFPTLARHAARGQRKEFRSELERALGQSLFMALPASVGLMLIAPPLIEVAFQHQAFNADDALAATQTTICLAAGLPAITMAQLHARALFALGDARSPAMVAFILVPTNLVLNLIMVLLLKLDTAGLAMATTLCSIGQATLLRRRLLAVCVEPPDRTRSLLPVLIGTAAMAACVVGVQQLVQGDEWWEIGLLEVLLPVVAGMASYAVAFRVSAGGWRLP